MALDLKIILSAADYASGTLHKAGGAVTGLVDTAVRGVGRLFSLRTLLAGELIGSLGERGVRFVEGIIGPAAEWESQKAKLTVALKDATRGLQMFEWAKRFAATTPFEMGEVVDATVRLQLYGMSAQKWLPLVGNMAGAMGKSITDATEAVADSIRGEQERLKEFGISTPKLIAAGAHQAAQGLGIASQTMEDQEAIAKSLERVIKNTFGGGMQSMMKTWVGTVSNVKDAWTQVKGEIGQGLLPILKTAAGETTTWLNNIRTSGVAQTIGRELGEAVDWAWSRLKGMGGWIATNWPEVKRIFRDAWAGFREGLEDLRRAGVGFSWMRQSVGGMRDSLSGIDLSLEKLAEGAATGQRAALWLGEALVVLEMNAKAAEYAFLGVAWAINKVFELGLKSAAVPRLFTRDPGGFGEAAEQAQREMRRLERRSPKDMEKLERIWDAQDRAYGVQRPGGPRFPLPAAGGGAGLGATASGGVKHEHSGTLKVHVTGSPEMMREMLRNPEGYRAFEEALRRQALSAGYGARVGAGR